MLLLDVDHLKLVNTAPGHAAGDSVLVALGQTMRSVLRAEDLLARIGGEEFAVLARDTGYLGACRLAARLREDVGRMRMLHGDGEEPVVVPISIGAVSIAPESTATMSDVLAAADGNLYAAKAAGRNVEEVSRLGNSVDAASARRRVMHTYRFADQHAAHAGKRVGQPKTER
jgi:diguanylate cyclase (GGDEF)-like protein